MKGEKMTIREWILEGTIKAYEIRLEKLIEIGAPKVVIEGQKKMVAELKDGELKIGGDLDVLEDEFVSCTIKTGRGGKKYYLLNEDVNFFPAAKYGLFIKKAGKETK